MTLVISPTPTTSTSAVSDVIAALSKLNLSMCGGNTRWVLRKYNSAVGHDLRTLQVCVTSCVGDCVITLVLTTNGGQTMAICLEVIKISPKTLSRIVLDGGDNNGYSYHGNFDFEFPNLIQEVCSIMFTIFFNWNLIICLN